MSERDISSNRFDADTHHELEREMRQIVSGKSTSRQISSKELNKLGRTLFSVTPFDFAEDVTMHSKEPLMYFIGPILIEIRRPPQDPNALVFMVEEAITEFFHQRDKWQRELPFFIGPYVFLSGPKTTCTVEARSRYALDHVRVNRARNNLSIVLPHPRKWIRLGLGWLFEPQCPCGKPECVPAPWRNTICRNGY